MMKKWFLGGLLAAVLTASAVWFGISLHAAYQTLVPQFGPDIVYENDTLKVLPNGVRCIQHICNPMESLAATLFFRGERIDPAESAVFQPELDYDIRYNVKYYRIRGRDNLSAMIVKSDDCPTRIVVPCNFTSYCAYFSDEPGVSCAHDTIFPAIMADFFGCEDASDIAAIRVELAPFNEANNQRNSALDRKIYEQHKASFTPSRITDRDTIDAVWNALLESDLFNYMFGFSGAPPFPMAICNTNTAEKVDFYYNDSSSERAKAASYHIFLEFHDGSFFRLQHTSCDYTFWFPQEPFGGKTKALRSLTPEFLYFPPEQLQEIRELLGIAE